MICFIHVVIVPVSSSLSFFKKPFRGWSSVHSYINEYTRLLNITFKSIKIIFRNGEISKSLHNLKYNVNTPKFYASSTSLSNLLLSVSSSFVGDDRVDVLRVDCDRTESMSLCYDEKVRFFLESYILFFSDNGVILRSSHSQHLEYTLQHIQNHGILNLNFSTGNYIRKIIGVFLSLIGLRIRFLMRWEIFVKIV